MGRDGQPRVRHRPDARDSGRAPPRGGGARGLHNPNAGWNTRRRNSPDLPRTLYGHVCNSTRNNESARGMPNRERWMLDKWAAAAAELPKIRLLDIDGELLAIASES